VLAEWSWPMNPRIGCLSLRSDPCDGLDYKTGLDRQREAVISSHFMHKLINNAELRLYEEGEFSSKSLAINGEAVYRNLLPTLLRSCQTFSSARALAAKIRARENHGKYGLDHPSQVGVAEFITEVMFDRQYQRGPRESCSRRALCQKVTQRIASGSPIEMVIPALPFKFSSPLKSRGRLPDLAEVNFILGLYEIAATIEVIYREARPDIKGPLAAFTVVSDGSRFNRLVDESDDSIEGYRTRLNLWIRRLALERYITLVDYRFLLQNRLPVLAWEAKAAIRNRARSQYAAALWPIFDPNEMHQTIVTAARIEPDPECSNPEGRFVSVVKSLIYTINYKVLRVIKRLPARYYCALYRDLTGHIFEPYTLLSISELRQVQEQVNGCIDSVPTLGVKEYLRQSMLREAWSAAIEYMAEIKSDRELEEDPILTCLPDHFRWTIHAKSGQLAIMTPTALGTSVQAWAGAAVFKRAKSNKIKLCTLPVLALEGIGAIPVTVSGCDELVALADQPLFYIYPDVTFNDLNDFLQSLRTSLVRKRTS
jgi:hypothetical protein